MEMGQGRDNRKENRGERNKRNVILHFWELFVGSCLCACVLYLCVCVYIVQLKDRCADVKGYERSRGAICNWSRFKRTSQRQQGLYYSGTQVESTAFHSPPLNKSQWISSTLLLCFAEQRDAGFRYCMCHHCKCVCPSGTDRFRQSELARKADCLFLWIKTRSLWPLVLYRSRQRQC